MSPVTRITTIPCTTNRTVPFQIWTPAPTERPVMASAAPHRIALQAAVTIPAPPPAITVTATTTST